MESILGNNIKITNEYDTNGYLSKTIHDKTSAPTNNILTLTTKFDYKTDNLDERTNSIFGNTETFKYDGISRLNEFTNKLGVQETQNYEASGKIKDNNLGTYNYDVTKPYQNNSITLGTEALNYYSARGALFNATMEDQTGWSYAIYDNTIGHESKTSIKLSQDPYIGLAKYNKLIEINNSQATEYNYSVWVKGNAQYTLMVINGYAENGATLEFSDFMILSDTSEWTKIEKTVIIPASVKKIEVFFYYECCFDAWFDDMQINKANKTANKLDVSYNAFKSPIQIEETDIDKISFTYNDDNQRSIMYYGGLGDKLDRPFQKHYSADGSMEVKQNLTTGAIEFVTYIGGDGYSAPIVAKSDGVNQLQYLYLHRDYQGTILAITDANAAIVEKRLFDAWGDIINVQDGAGNTLNGLTVLDRGYTGHEHLQSVGLINMNARLYDPIIHRFLQVDNYIQDITNTQNFNNYGYVFNNPLSNTDITGNSCDCPGGGGINVGSGSEHGSSIDIEQLGKYTGIDKWMRKNLNFKNWGKRISGWFGGGSSGPPPNVSKYGNIQMPTQHSSFGFNWTFLSEGKPFSRFIYGFFNGFYTTGQYFIGRGVGDYSMRNLNGSATDTDEAVWGLVGAVSSLTSIGEAKIALSELKTVTAVESGGFGAMMNVDEAARYARYWTKHAPRQTTVGIKRMDWFNVSSCTGRTEASRVIFDDYGRQIFRVDYSNHMRPTNHSLPHLHQYEFGIGYSHGKETVFNFF